MLDYVGTRALRTYFRAFGGPVRWRRWGFCRLVVRGLRRAGRQRPLADTRRHRRRKHRQEIAQLRDYYAQLNKLNTVAYRITTANREFCKKWVVAQLGMTATTPQSLPSKYRKFSHEALGLRWVRPTVISLVPDGPADKAGIMDKDELISFNGEPVPVTALPRWINAFMEDNDERPIKVELRRGDEERPLSDTGDRLRHSVSLKQPDPNAFTDPEKS